MTTIVAMVTFFFIWWCITFMCMCIELCYQIYKVCHTHNIGVSLWWHDWYILDTAFYTTIIFLITEAMFFIWR